MIQELFIVIVAEYRNNLWWISTERPDKMAAKAKAAAKGKKRAQRATSNVFAMFDQAQIQEFKEAFNMIDQNHDGFIDKEDLHDMLASLGTVTFLCHCLLHCHTLNRETCWIIKTVISGNQHHPSEFWCYWLGVRESISAVTSATA